MKHSRLLSLLFCLTAGIGTMLADMSGQWKMHPTFDLSFSQLIDTPDRVFIGAYPVEFANTDQATHDPVMNVFCWDKKAEEMLAYTKTDRLTEQLVRYIAYNYRKKYLMVIYDNLNIDLLYDNGKTVNIGSLMVADVPGDHIVTNVWFAPEGNDVYIATGFGYVCLDDEGREIKEARNYGQRLNGVCLAGDRIIVGTTQETLLAPKSAPRTSLSDYTVLPGLTKPRNIYGVDDSHFVLWRDADKIQVVSLTPQSEVHNIQLLVNSSIKHFLPTDQGWTSSSGRAVYTIRQGSFNTTYSLLQGGMSTSLFVCNDGKKVYGVTPKFGFREFNVAGNNWTLVRDFIRPNSPATHASFNMVYHPTAGMIVASRGADGTFTHDDKTPNRISALKGGFWKELDPEYTDPDRNSLGDTFFGLSIDPADQKYIYRGSTFWGILRLNVNDAKDLLHLSRSNDPDRKADNFIPIHEPRPRWGTLSRFYNPQFDNDGTMWCLSTDLFSVELWNWPKADRLATTGPASYRPMNSHTYEGLTGSMYDRHLVLRHSNNKNLIVVFMNTPRTLAVIDTKGTLNTGDDDRVFVFKDIRDQDGGIVDTYRTSWLYEDTATGLVWVATPTGVFNFNPKTAITQQVSTVNRIKVSRNDGTSLADYLLNQVSVSHISQDGQGRKWFSTNGAGIVCTSNDGRRILAEFTTDNSELPSNQVYSAYYNPEDDSMMISTENGLVEFFPAGGGSGDITDPEVRAYPNPVEPDYYGYVTIDGLPDNSLVKIMDASGGLVRDLGVAENGSIQWDVMGLDHKRVATGVYYILVSGGPGSQSSTACKGKILVMQ